MTGTTKTGLSVSPRKQIVRSFKFANSQTSLPCAITKPAVLSLRPFGGLFNPYHSKGCSVLCNHPASNEMKNIVRMAKDALINEGKNLLCNNEKNQNFQPHFTETDHIPEDLFRRYTDTDSRPLTPAPTIASARTRTSICGTQQNTRRCVTPDPQSIDVNERKQLILDLRRSHSQETLYWNASSELSPTQPAQPVAGAKPERAQSGLPQIQSESDLTKSTTTPICMNARDDGEEDGIRRRGKKPKKPKPVTATFQPSHDPETQVAQITHTDSPSFSTRPSLIPGGGDMPSQLAKQSRTTAIEDSMNKSIFLDETSLRILRRGLNIDLMEEVFNKTKKRALQEAFRATVPEQLEFESDAVRSMKENLNLPEIDHNKWLNLPRKYKRYATRFELPMDAKEFLTLTPLSYLVRYVYVSANLKQLYHRIFIKYLPEEATQSILNKTGSVDSESETSDLAKKKEKKLKKEIKLVERKLSWDVLDAGLQEVLGFHGTLEKIAEIKEVLDFGAVSTGFIELNFRLWCGLVAFSERYLTTLTHEQDPRHEIEMIDFEALNRKIKAVQPCAKLMEMLIFLKGGEKLVSVEIDGFN